MENNYKPSIGNYLARIVATAVITVGPSIAMANNVKKAPEKKQGIEAVLDGTGQLIGNTTEFIVDAAGNLIKATGGLVSGTGKLLDDYFREAKQYGTVDDHLYRPLKPGQNRLGQILYATEFFPGHYIITARDGAVGIARIPGEAMARAKAEKNKQAKPKSQSKNNENSGGLGNMLRVPLEVVWNTGKNIWELGEDTTRVSKHVLFVSADGIIRTGQYILENPADAGVQGGATYGIIRIFSGNGNGHHGAGGPPPPPWP